MRCYAREMMKQGWQTSVPFHSPAGPSMLIPIPIGETKQDKALDTGCRTFWSVAVCLSAIFNVWVLWV